MATNVKLRRTQSSKIEDSQQVERKERFLSDCKPIHSHADSLFSTSSGFTNYYGILNLCLILLVLGNARLFLENIIKYGILINYGYLTDWFLREPYNWPNLLLTVSIAIFPAIALLTEKLLAQGKISNRVGVIIYIINLGVLLLFPAAVIYYLHPIIVFSIFTLGNVTICFLKLISYAHVNYWCRENYSAKKLKRRSSSGNVIENQSANNVGETYQTYPNNINVKVSSEESEEKAMGEFHIVISLH
ncbi:Diacylglycerol O-acyltransferase 1 [Bulinus truncatus]|nr:Diacylglycerol O-acyltransferase 1 [Bulinus truncatus]